MKIKKEKTKSKAPLTEAEIANEKMKLEIAEELGLLEKVQSGGWKSLSAKETGRVGGLMTKRKRLINSQTEETNK